MTALTILLISMFSSLSGGTLAAVFCYNRLQTKLVSGGNDRFANPVFAAGLMLLVGAGGFYIPSTILSQHYLANEPLQTGKSDLSDRTSSPVINAVPLEE